MGGRQRAAEDGWLAGSVARGEGAWGMSNGSSVKFSRENSSTFLGSRVTAES